MVLPNLLLWTKHGNTYLANLAWPTQIKDVETPAIMRQQVWRSLFWSISIAVHCAGNNVAFAHNTVGPQFEKVITVLYPYVTFLQG